MLKELKTKHRTIIQMSFNGFQNNEIAERMSMSAPTISNIINSPLGKAYLGGLNDRAKENTLDVRKQLVAMNSNALAAFERILNPEEKAPHSVQFNTARDILDRNGFKPTDKLNIDMTLQAKSDEELDAEITALTNSIANSAKTLDRAKEQEQTQEEQSREEQRPEQSLEIISNSLAASPESPESSKLHDPLADVPIDCFPPR